jgi:translation initiation factor 4A
MFANIACILFSICQYSDLAEAERALVFEKFRQATMNWNQNVSAQSGDDSEIGKDEQKSHMIVVTDVCLPLVASGELPISARVLINYELPTKKVQSVPYS